jgi:hypothetical protein
MRNYYSIFATTVDPGNLSVARRGWSSMASYTLLVSIAKKTVVLTTLPSPDIIIDAIRRINHAAVFFVLTRLPMVFAHWRRWRRWRERRGGRIGMRDTGESK